MDLAKRCQKAAELLEKRRVEAEQQCIDLAQEIGKAQSRYESAQQAKQDAAGKLDDLQALRDLWNEDGSVEQDLVDLVATILPSKVPKVVPPRPKKVVKRPEPSKPDMIAAFSFQFADDDHPKWGAPSLTHETVVKALQKMKGLSSMKWEEIDAAESNHYSPVFKLAKEARDRLTNLGLEGFDPLYQMRVEGSYRLHGWRSGAIFHVIWLDPNHEIWPTNHANN